MRVLGANRSVAMVGYVFRDVVGPLATRVYLVSAAEGAGRGRVGAVE